MDELRKNVGLVDSGNISISELLQKAEAGDAEAQCQLGICFYDSAKTEKDLEKAIYWLRKAAWRGNADAQNRLHFSGSAAVAFRGPGRGKRRGGRGLFPHGRDGNPGAAAERGKLSGAAGE